VLRKTSFVAHLTSSLLYGGIVAFLLAIGLLVWQAAAMHSTDHVTRHVSVGPFMLATISKQATENGKSATFSLDSGWPGYLLASGGGSVAISLAVWRYRQTHASSDLPDSHTLSGSTDV
jgi:hypothetical protein